MTDTAVNLLVDTAKSLVTYYYGLISGQTAEREALERELDQLNGMVAGALKTRNTKSEEFIVWLRQSRELVLHVEDTMAACVTQAEVERASNNWVYRKLNVKKVGLAEAVKELRTARVTPELADLRSRLSELPLADPSTATETRIRRQRGKNPSLENLISREVETDKLVKCLTARSASSEKYEVLSIVGMAGLGKTTLAWKIYKEKGMKNVFPTVIWVNVSEEFNKEDILLKIIEKFKEDDPSGKNVDELSEMVRKRLEKEIFLIFFDDVWTTGDWQEIKKFLPVKSNKLSKVLITTRTRSVGIFASGSTGVVHDLKLLEDEESWKLLDLVLFTLSDTKCPKYLHETGKKIAKKCGGVPLAIVMIAGVLYEKWRKEERKQRAKEEWEKVYNDESYLIKDGKENEGLGQIISFSYQTLSPELKECFLYTGIFPEDTEISVWRLTQLWIVEGLINYHEGTTLEGTAQDYVNDLIDKNLLMVVKVRPDGKVKTCRVHDLIRSFCKREASNLFQEITWSTDGFVPGIKEIERNGCRRICIHSSLEQFLKTKPNIQKARSFLSFSKDTITWKEKDLPPINDAFNVLRVLDVDRAIQFLKFPNELTRLVLLKYVTLSGAKFSVLPEELYKLWNVQTLEVYTLSPTLKLKANIWKMRQLRHFKTKASIILSKKDGKGRGGENLRTLNRLSPQSCNEKVFSNAENLNTLGIRGKLSMLLDPNSCLEKLVNLEKLKLVNDLYGVKAPNKEPSLCLPLPAKFPPKLKILTLSATCLKWEQMATLCDLPNLEVLKLKHCAFDGNRWDAAGICFKHLESLFISDAGLVFWTASTESFPKLADLVLKDCKDLKELPSDLVKELQLLHMDGVSHRAIISARKLEQEMENDQGNKNEEKRGFKLVIV